MTRLKTTKKPAALLALVAAAAIVIVAAVAARGGDDSAPDFGAGVFGHWITDEYGLPAYRYQMRHDDPAAVWDPKTEPKTNLMWHQLGNDRINATAFNLGFVQLFYAESGARWLNEYQPKLGEHAGGFGWLIDGDTVLIDRDELVPAGAAWERVFGAGYYKKRLEAGGLSLERVIFAPRVPAMLPLLVSEVSIENHSGRDRELVLIEYWDVNIRLLTDVLMGRGLAARAADERVRMTLRDADPPLLLAEPPKLHGDRRGYPDRPTPADPELPAVFLASLDQAPDAWITDPTQLFDGATIKTDPADLRRAGDAKPDDSPRSQHRACLAARLIVRVPAGGAALLRFEYGYEKGTPAEEVVGQALAAALEDSKRPEPPAGKKVAPTTMAEWAVEVPTLELGQDRFLERELRWDYYYLVSASLYDAYYDKRRVPQGANYLYYSGMDGATRDHAAFAQALTYYRPEQAREILEFMARCQETSGRLFYDLGGYGQRYINPYRPGDLDIWFLWALSEYVFATRDFDFLDQVEPFYPRAAGREAPIWEHAVRSLDHFVNHVGVGKNGHPRMKLSDWNDEMTWLASGMDPIDIIATIVRGESVFNTAMACVMAPMFAELARRHGDAATAAIADDLNQRMRAALNSAWHDDHLIRAYSGLGKPYGEDLFYLEPAAWALLADGALSPEREQVMVETMLRELKAPSELGMMISTSTSGSATTRPGEQEEGGIWFAINGPAAVGLARLNPAAAWDEVKKNSLGWHAHVYPETWFGIWSGPDAWNSAVSNRPSETWYMKTPIINTGPQMYPVQNAHSHSQTMWAIARIAGVNPTARGWTVAPRIPLERYRLDCALFELEVSPGRVAGKVKTPLDADFTLTVAPPPGSSTQAATARVDGQPVELERSDAGVSFKLAGRGAGPVSWEVVFGR